MNFCSRLKVFFQIIKVLQYLKDIKIIHDDIKPKNNIVKVIDYGCTGDLENETFLQLTDDNYLDRRPEILRQMKGRMTPSYYHPNIKFEDVFHENFDIFGLGVILKKLFLE